MHTWGADGSVTVPVVSLLFLPKFSTLNNARLPWDHTPPPILIGRFTLPLIVGFMHVQGSYLWRNCPQLCLHCIPGQDDPLVSFHKHPFGYGFQNKCHLSVTLPLWHVFKYWARMRFSKHLSPSFGDLFSDEKILSIASSGGGGG